MDRRTWIGWLVLVLLSPFLLLSKKPKEPKWIEDFCQKRKQRRIGIDPAEGSDHTSVVLMCGEPTGFRVISVIPPKSWQSMDITIAKE